MVRQMEIKWKGKEIFFPVEMKKKKKTIKILVLNKKRQETIPALPPWDTAKMNVVCQYWSSSFSCLPFKN